MARRLRFNGTGSGGTGCPSLHGFWSFDGRLVITEDWHAELWLDDADTIATAGVAVPE
ncbi:hypothetical protein ACFRFL_05355 [Streptomyces sp. NPDC056708]|uniref:hypothetical protein n=1 Tax=unclassified Streptomyces TaxID=2593676 RepID=UPI0036B037D5